MNWVSKRSGTALSLIAAALVLVGCGGSNTGTDIVASGSRVENAELGLAIAELPEGFEVDKNDETGLVLITSGSGDPGVVEIDLGPVEEGSVNIVEAATATKAVFESLPGGEFFGNQELLTPIGSFFTARGAFDEDPRRVEQLLAFTLHPNSNRLVRISFRYAAGEAGDRAPQFAALLGEIAGYEPGSRSEAPAGGAN